MNPCLIHYAKLLLSIFFLTACFFLRRQWDIEGVQNLELDQDLGKSLHLPGTQCFPNSKTRVVAPIFQGCCDN